MIIILSQTDIVSFFQIPFLGLKLDTLLQVMGLHNTYSEELRYMDVSNFSIVVVPVCLI